jgi:hypothetical protein
LFISFLLLRCYPLYNPRHFFYFHYIPLIYRFAGFPSEKRNPPTTVCPDAVPCTHKSCLPSCRGMATSPGSILETKKHACRWHQITMNQCVSCNPVYRLLIPVGLRRNTESLFIKRRLRSGKR